MEKVFHSLQQSLLSLEMDLILQKVQIQRISPIYSNYHYLEEKGTYKVIAKLKISHLEEISESSRRTSGAEYFAVNEFEVVFPPSVVASSIFDIPKSVILAIANELSTCFVFH